jgi:hypothetical protein
VAIERMSNATLAVDPLTGRPLRVTNGRDVADDAALPDDPSVWVDTRSPCQTHGAPPTENPYHQPRRRRSHE